MSRKPSNYWEKRSTNLMLALEKDTQYAINDLLKIYEQATKDINEEIERVFKNYGKNSGLNKQTLEMLLNTKETERHYKNLLTTINTIKDPKIKNKLITKYNAPAYNYRISRLQELQENIDKEIYKMANLEQKISEVKYTKNINEAFYQTIFDIQKGIGYGFSFSQINDKKIKLLLKNKWNGNENYSSLIWKNAEKLSEYLKINLASSIFTGKSLPKISKELAEYMNIGKYNATRLIRTETNYFVNEAEALAYEECGIEKYQFIATLDIRTCGKCGELDNKVFLLKDKKVGVNFPPIHPNDRCTTVAYFDDGIEEKLKRRARNPKTSKTYLIDSDMSYEEWKKSINNGAFDVYQKTNANIQYDRKQYLNYKNVIGIENLPKTFEKYQNMKYNNSEEYNLMKSYYKQYIEKSFPNDMTYKIYKDNLNNSNWKAVGFNPNYVESHKKHLKDFNNISFEEYQEKAKKLLNSEGDKILMIISKEGTRFRYDIENNEFACARPNGITQTYFKPRDEIEYWKREVVNKYAKK